MWQAFANVFSVLNHYVSHVAFLTCGEKIFSFLKTWWRRLTFQNVVSYVTKMSWNLFPPSFLHFYSVSLLFLWHHQAVFHSSHILTLSLPLNQHRFADSNTHTITVCLMSATEVTVWLSYPPATPWCPPSRLHHCNSCSACNSKPGFARVILPPFHHDSGSGPGHMSHMRSCAAGLVITLFKDWQQTSQRGEAALVWLRSELDRSWCKYSCIRCFSFDDRFICGNKAFGLLFSCEKLKGNCRGTVPAGFMSYRCESAPGVQSGSGAFEAKGLYRETVISHTGRARLSTVSSENWISIPWD